MKLNYHFRYCLPLIDAACGDAGLPVFMVIMSHFNSRNRSFPSYDTIQYFTRFSRQSISDAIDGLIELGMLTLVPVDKREENEKEIHGNANVYQGTGCLKIESLTIVFADFDWESEGLVPSDKNDIRQFIASHFSNPKIKSSDKTQKLVFSLDHKRIQRSLKKGTTPKKKEKDISAPNGTGDETAISLSELPSNEKQPIHPKTQRKSEQWLAISQAVDSTIYEGLTRDALHGWICDYLYMWHEATPSQVENFVKWYTASHGEMVKQITRIKGTPRFEGKFCFWFEKWLKETRAKVVKLAPVPMDTPQYMQGVRYE